jgi:hypothetical protein
MQQGNARITITFFPIQLGPITNENTELPADDDRLKSRISRQY